MGTKPVMKNKKVVFASVCSEESLVWINSDFINNGLTTSEGIISKLQDRVTQKKKSKSIFKSKKRFNEAKTSQNKHFTIAVGMSDSYPETLADGIFGLNFTDNVAPHSSDMSL